MKNYIRVTSEFTAGGIQMNIFIYDSSDLNNQQLIDKNAKKLNLFLDKYSDAEPFDGFEVINEPAGARTKNLIKEIREYLQ